MPISAIVPSRQQLHSTSAGRRLERLLTRTYLLASAAGLIGTWMYNLRFEGDSYLGSWFATLIYDLSLSESTL